MKKIVSKIKGMFKTLARRILKDEIEARCDAEIKINHAAGMAHDELVKILHNKKVTKAQMTEAMERAVAQLEEAYRAFVFR